MLIEIILIYFGLIILMKISFLPLKEIKKKKKFGLKSRFINDKFSVKNYLKPDLLYPHKG